MPPWLAGGRNHRACDDAAMSSRPPHPPGPAPAPASPAVPMPADWPALWQVLLQARSAGPAGRAAARAAWRAWQPGGAAGNASACAHGLADAITPASADWLSLYAPLLAARWAADDAATPAAPARPWALGQLGQSLDGCVATASGDSYYVTGPQSLVHLHRLRALCDAVLVGAGTVAADDPQLTTRHVPGPQPLRVVLDPAARLDGRARVLSDGRAPTLWLCDSRHAAAAQARRAPGGAEVLAVDGLLPAGPAAEGAPAARPGPQLALAFAALAQRGVRVLLVEGGGVTVSRCLAAGLLQRLHLVTAPVIIGAGRRGLQQPAPLRMADCLRPPARRLALGDDMLWDLDLDLDLDLALAPDRAAAAPGG